MQTSLLSATDRRNIADKLRRSTEAAVFHRRSGNKAMADRYAAQSVRLAESLRLG